MNVETNTQVDLTNCDREPIHLLGKIQTFGFLLGVTSDWIVSFASQNIASFLPVDAVEDLLGRPLTDVLDGENIHAIRNHLQRLGSRSGTQVAPDLAIGDDDARYDVSIHASGDTIVLEFEPHDAIASVPDQIANVQSAIQRVSGMDDITKCLGFAVRFVKAMAGYDRVMAYRFLPDESGEVVAEALSPGMEPFLNLRYPASDIPKQARALYIRNPIRLIADVLDDGTAIAPAEGAGLDLSDAVLRSVSSIHLEYLRNMGVGASMSVSIIVDDKLWGLIACHHNSPHRLGQSTRNSLLLFGQMLSLVLRERLATQDRRLETRTRELTNAISRTAGAESSVVELLFSYADEIMELMDAEGITIMLDGQVHSLGLQLTPDEVTLIAKQLNRSPPGNIIATSELGQFVSAGTELSGQVAGLLAIPISKTPRDYIMFLRREVAKKVTWGGNPEKPATLGPNGIRLTPRKSFETWQAIVKGQSEEWLGAHFHAAEQLRITFLEVVLRLVEEASRERKQASEKQELLIAELNHRVRNILSLVRSLINQTRAGNMTTADFARVLDSRIQSLARAHDQITKENWSPASLKVLIETESEGYLQDSEERVVLSGNDVLLVPTAYSSIALVIHELITNSAKYGALSVQAGRVDIVLERKDDEALVLTWEESGGPPVQAPTRKGFGTTIIERTIPYELQGQANVELAVSGLRAEFYIPAVHVREAPRVKAPRKRNTSAQKNRPKSLAFPRKVLMVEDNLLIAMDSEDVLRRLGAEDIQICGNVQTALQALEQNKFEFAILDINLGTETSVPVANKLMTLGTPFIFASGYGESSVLPKDMRHMVVLSKPYGTEGIRTAWLEAKHD
jgi:light-regulated signal transduction histidine kinase (bacteriophytochrome)